ncbi:glycosyltransferase family 2 protein [Candidatus Falkowbacteria bacterium]|nr:glycosyltransferase family 2 protein [Candidatus Falkowbacteria bacterium]
MNEKVDLTIIIVSWNVKDLLKSCLESIAKAQGSLNLEVFVVDNASTDGTAEELENDAKLPASTSQDSSWRGGRKTCETSENAKSNLNIKIILNKENLGFAKANNQAIRKANGEFILLLNPDMKLFPDTLINIVDWMKQNPQAKIAGCHLVDKRGQTVSHVRQFPTITDQLAIILKLPHIFPNILNKYLRKNFDYTRAQKVDSVRGSFFMIRSNLNESETPASRLQKGEDSSPHTVGGDCHPRLLDERYFLWFEEVDFCRQVQQGKGEVWYTPSAKAIDHVGRSFKQLPRGKTQKYFMSSQLKYFQKWHPKPQYLLLKLAWPLGLAIAWMGEKLNLKSKTKT